LLFADTNRVRQSDDRVSQGRYWSRHPESLTEKEASDFSQL
jgi:hypothetical protein